MIKFLNYKKWDNDKKETIVEQIPIRVSYIALKRMKNTFGRALSLDDDGTDYEAYEALLYQSTQLAYQMLGEPYPFTIEDMELLMDGVYVEFQKIVPEFFEDGNNDGTDKIAGKGKDGPKKSKSR